MSTTRLTGIALSTVMAATTVSAQDIPEVNSRFEFIEAHPEDELATISEGDFTRAMDCEELKHFQQNTELDAIAHASTFIAFGTDDRWKQDLKMRLALGHETLKSAFTHFAEIVNGDEQGSFAYAAQLGAERQVFITGQIEAGCFAPSGLK